MKKVKVNYSAFYGCDCMGCGYGSDETGLFEVSDQVADLIEQMLEQNDGDVNQDDITTAIQEGHTELQSLCDAIDEQCSDMVVRYWLFEADNECIDETLEPAFWEDIENGIYVPEKSIEQVLEEYKEAHPEELDSWDWDKEGVQHYLYYNTLEDDYLKWVNSHDDDYLFIAERVGVDLDGARNTIKDSEFTIEEVIEA